MTAPRLIAGCAPPGGGYDADIVILSHHRLAETIAAIRSAQAQGGTRCHVIVLDQDSPAGTREALAAAVSEADTVGLYIIDANLGVGGGRNLATSLGHGRAIIALDNDAVFAGPDVAARAVRRLGADPGLGAIGFRILAADGRGLDLTSWGYPRALIPRAGERFPVTTFVGCGHAISRACWERLGGYDASLFFTWEEYEFSLRAIEAGWRIEHHGDLAVIHGVSPEARVEWSGVRWRQFVRNRLLIARDWNGAWGAAPRALAYLAKGARDGRLSATIRAIDDARALAASRPRRSMTAPMRAYLWANEARHRLRIGASSGASAARAEPMAASPASSCR
ncbi:MAG TPA: glycosyltransferase [Acetobacteraceae bacterium]|nr:glycosyltransferase [Acetobacteraceae bacterium]